MPPSIDFKILPDPQGHTGVLKLKGDWVFVRISDGRHAGLGEATHSGDDLRCVERMREMYAAHIQNRAPSLESVRELQLGEFSKAQDFLTATAISALDQALYDLLARREGVPVWRLFAPKPARDRVELYTTINRVLTSRTEENYRQILSQIQAQGFRHFKCAPFERVTPEGDQAVQSQAGLALLRALKPEYSGLGMRIDFHARFKPENFLAILPEIEKLSPEWIEEPSPIGPAYASIRQATALPLAAGELYFGSAEFAGLLERDWVDVIMPDVKHVGGFGPLLDVCALAARNDAEVSPHNPAGPVSTAASLHAAALHDCVTSLEFPFDPQNRRSIYGERIEDGFLCLSERPGWGIEWDRLGGDR